MFFALKKKKYFLEALTVYIGWLYVGMWNLMHEVATSVVERVNKQLLSYIMIG